MWYAINEKTKEHRVCRNQFGTPGDGWLMVPADADGWIKWDGGECPLPGDVRCDIKLRYGGAVRHKAGCIDWARTSCVAYRPILEDSQTADEDIDEMPAEAEAPEWDGAQWPPQVGHKLECCGYIAEVIHIDGPYVVGWAASSATSGLLERQDCRPIRSEEDQFAESAVAYMERAVENKTGDPANSRHLEVAAKALYRAGYRKTNTNTRRSEMTPCEKLGYKVGDRFEAGEYSLFSDGSIVELFRDDGTESPLWRLVAGRCPFRNSDGEAGAFDSVHFFTKIKRQNQGVNMTNITLKSGDYVSTEGMTEEQYHAVAKAFMEAGAQPGVSGKFEGAPKFLYLGWNRNINMVDEWPLAPANGRHLTIDQVLGTQSDEQDTIEALLAKADKHEQKAAKHKAKRQECIDKARELMPEGWGIDEDRKRIRLGDEPKEDMSDPANWRKGDKLRCISDSSEWVEESGIRIGDIVTMSEPVRMDEPVLGLSVEESEYFLERDSFRFHHRPS